MCCVLLSGSTCVSQAEVLTNLPGFFHLPFAPSDLLLISLERAGAGGGHWLKEHLSPVSCSEKVMGQVEASQRGWIQPTGYELVNAELIKIMDTGGMEHPATHLHKIPISPCNCNVSSPWLLKVLCDYFMVSILKTCVLKYCTLTTKYWQVKIFFQLKKKCHLNHYFMQRLSCFSYTT